MAVSPTNRVDRVIAPVSLVIRKQLMHIAINDQGPHAIELIGMSGRCNVSIKGIGKAFCTLASPDRLLAQGAYLLRVRSVSQHMTKKIMWEN